MYECPHTLCTLTVYVLTHYTLLSLLLVMQLAVSDEPDTNVPATPTTQGMNTPFGRSTQSPNTLPPKVIAHKW